MHGLLVGEITVALEHARVGFSVDQLLYGLRIEQLADHRIAVAEPEHRRENVRVHAGLFREHARFAVAESFPVWCVERTGWVHFLKR